MLRGKWSCLINSRLLCKYMDPWFNYNDHTIITLWGLTGRKVGKLFWFNTLLFWPIHLTSPEVPKFQTKVSTRRLIEHLASRNTQQIPHQCARQRKVGWLLSFLFNPQLFDNDGLRRRTKKWARSHRVHLPWVVHRFEHDRSPSVQEQFWLLFELRNIDPTGLLQNKPCLNKVSYVSVLLTDSRLQHNSVLVKVAACISGLILKDV